MPSVMDSTVKILKTILCFPFLMGPKKIPGWDSMETNSNSALVLIVCLVSIFGAVIVVFRNQHTHDEYEDLHSVSWRVISYLMTIATIDLFVLLLSYFNPRGQLISQHVIETDHDPSSKFQLGFLWTFGLGLIVKISLTIAEKIQCTNAGNLYTEIANIGSSFVMIGFVLSQMTPIFLTRKSSFCRRLWIFYSVGIIILSNASVWLHLLLAVIADNLTQPGNTSTEWNLMWNNCNTHTKIHAFEATLSPFLFDIFSSFFLLATLFYLNMWSSFSKKSIAFKDDLPSSNKLKTNSTRKVKIVSAALGIVINIPFFLICLCLRFVYSDTEVMHGAWTAIKSVQKSLMLLLIIIAFSCLKEKETILRSRGLEFSDLFLLCCFAGKVARHVPRIITAWYCYRDTHVLLFRGLISVVFYLYNTMYILISKRYSQTSFNTSNVSMFIHVLLFTLSIAQWIVAALILSMKGNHVVSDGQGCLFENPHTWTIIQCIITPFSSYYNFQSAVHFYKVSL